MKYKNHISQEELEQIERYLSGGMEHSETLSFEALLASDENLRAKTEEVKLLLLGIQERELEQQLGKFHTEMSMAGTEQAQKGRIIPYRKWLVAASVLAVLALAGWWLLQSRNNAQKIYSKYYTPDPGLATVMSSSSNYIFEKAMVEYKNGEYQKALDAWTGLLREKPGNDTLLYFIGAAYQAENDHDRAIRNLQKASADTNSAFYREACWYLGLSYLEKGNKTLAIEYIEKSDNPQRAAILKAINKK